MDTVNSFQPRVGLALGSGGARGLAHIGVIKALEKHGIPIDMIAGCSIGSVIGGFYAAGLSTEEIETIALSTQGRKVFAILAEPHLKQKLTGKEAVRGFIESHLGKITFAGCHIPFTAMATDINTSESIALTSGELSSAIRASISVPIAFKPVTIDEHLLADGGLSAPVPVKAVRKMGADVVIAVNLDSYYYVEKWRSDLSSVAHNSLKIMSRHLADFDCLDADVVIDINAGDVRWFEFTHGQRKIELGEIAMEKALPRLQKILMIPKSSS